jgi:predicted HTH transcriptional regulator
VIGRRGPGRPKGSSSKAAAKGTKKRRRRRRGGTRADQAVNLIKQRPGITASEIAKSMKIKPNYLYRVLSDLEKQKKVKKKGRTYTAA